MSIEGSKEDILQDHIISRDYKDITRQMKQTILRYNPVNFGAYRYCGSGDMTFLRCHVIQI